MGLTTVYFIITLLLISTGSIVHEALAFKLTASSYDDGVNRGINDAQCDSNQCHGHGYDSSCPSGHTNTFCRGYAKGYSEGWDQQSGGGRSDEQTDRRSNGGTEDLLDRGNSNSNSDFSGNGGRSEQTGNQQSLTDKICNALSGGAGPALIPLLHAAGTATGGTLNAAMITAQGYCAIRGQ